MPLGPGARLGPYEIVARIGAGGMGEVWRARDGRLDRTVAIKVLNAELALQPDLRERFEREARAVSGFSHPNICALYDVGREGDVDYLVMEHLQGETLAARLAGGPLPLDLALRTAIEVGNALDAAHRQGVVHRDLKPGNVMLTKSGAKLLDFGLARKIGALGSRAGSAVFHDAPLTQEGTILGTIQYMAPEQLHGRDADARSDLFAFGAMLHEMVTGERAFPGGSQASVIAAILERTPGPLALRQPLASPALQRAVSRCLAKDPDDRWQSARDLVHELEWIESGGSDAGAPPPGAARRGRERTAWSIAGAALVALVALAAWVALGREHSKPARGPLRLAIASPTAGPYLFFNQCALSPDGRSVAFVAYGEAMNGRLWVRDLDAADARLLAATEGAEHPFWSPDGRSLGYTSEGKLRRVEVAGGPPVVLASNAASNSGAWSSDGTILFADSEKKVLARVEEGGGPTTPVTTRAPGDEAHRWPSFLPDGRHFLYLADANKTEDHHIRLGSLDAPGKDVTLFGAVSCAAFVEPGWILYVRGETLLAQRFDAKTLRLDGGPIPIARPIADNGMNHGFEFSASRSGLLAFRTADPRSYVAWGDRSGRVLERIGAPLHYTSVALSPDGKRAVYAEADADGRSADLWILELARGTSARWTFDPRPDYAPTWSPNGDRIAFTSTRDGSEQLLVGPSSRPGSEKLLVSMPGSPQASCFSPDGSLVCFDAAEKASEEDIWVVPADGSGEPRRAVATPAGEWGGQISPDGKWIAFESGESGHSEIYVCNWPAADRRWQISTAGGSRPRWRSDGTELFWVSGDRQVVAAKMAFGEEVAAASTTLIPVARSYGFLDVAPDGQRLFLQVPVEDWLQSPLTVVVDWTQTLPKR